MNSIWNTTIKMPEFPTLKKDIKTDVLIIGGGITGILTAYLLHQKGVNYILAEKGRICRGTTQNTTAKITFQHGLIYHKLLKNNGVEIAQTYLKANQIAFEKYAELCQNIDCDYEQRDNFIYTIDNRKRLENELEALQKLGYHAEFCSELPLPFLTAGAVKFSVQAQFNPLKFVSEIARNLSICENTFIRKMVGNTAISDNSKITADKVIVTTHFPFINKHGSYFLKLYQHRSYLLALENAPDVRGMYVDDNKTGYSFRNYDNLLLLGGGGHRTGKKGGNWNALRSLAKQYYPDAKEKFFWAAQDCMSLDSMPYIGQYSKRTPNMYTASGFNKWGMTGAMLSAILLSDMILEKKNDFADTFSPSRSILKPQLLLNGLETTKNLLTLSTKRCPHLGCALKWNRAEHSWDCPCHGSRFSASGKLLDNPANGDLR